MTDTMNVEKVRLVLTVEDEIRAALRLESAKREKDMSDLVAELVRISFPESVAEIRRRRKRGD